jgi:PE-PGRS C-terminal aspartyl peptidase-like domain
VIPNDQDAGPYLGAATGSGTFTYGAGTVNYTTYNASVNLGNGIITAPTTIGVASTWTPSGMTTPEPGTESPAIMGVGLNSFGPFPTASPVEGLPLPLG